MTTAFRTETEELDGGVTCVLVFGELDQATVPVLERALGPLVEGDGSVLIDLSSCEFIDSSGLAAFVAAKDGITATDGRKLVVCCPDAQVSRLFELTGLDRAMGLGQSRDDALATLRGASPEPA
ncbi:MAG: STAS domain-containing protein [Solirubrobacterales bacterium]